MCLLVKLGMVDCETQPGLILVLYDYSIPHVVGVLVHFTG